MINQGLKRLKWAIDLRPEGGIQIGTPKIQLSETVAVRAVMELEWAQKRITELEAQLPKWISVDDELPPIDTWVLWLDGNKTMTPHGSDCHIDKINKRGECLVNYTHNYTHWMPLPQPTKEQGHE